MQLVYLMEVCGVEISIQISVFSLYGFDKYIKSTI